jgi:VanZ family protein
MLLPFLPVWVIRKIAHMTLYAILAFCAACSQIKPSFKKVLLFCACYAYTDEFHQLFIPGRSGEIRDVCIDCLGACIGFLLFTGIKKTVKSRSF